MANQAHSGIRGIPWSRCARCGVDTPTDRLVIQPGKGRGAGLPVCTINGCLNETYPYEVRDDLIQLALENTPEEMEVAEILKSPPPAEDSII
jgi:hypothetical protein